MDDLSNPKEPIARKVIILDFDTITTDHVWATAAVSCRTPEASDDNPFNQTAPGVEKKSLAGD